MSSEFDPYRVWLSISPSEQPVNYYRLLGIPLFESDPDVISGAADRQMTHVRTFQAGKYSELSQRILNELSQARVTLLDQDKKAEYDAKLRAELNSSSSIINKGSLSSIGVLGEMQSPSPPASSLNEFGDAFSSSHSNHSHLHKNTVKKLRKKKTENESSSSTEDNADRPGHKKALPKYILYIGIAAIGLVLLIVFMILASNLSFNADSDEDSDELDSEYDSFDQPISPVNSQQGVREEAARRAGERMVKTVNGIEFAFRWCPPGTFIMGSPENELGRKSDETQHQVTLTKGFWIMETEVTVGMFKEFVKEMGYESKGDTPTGWTGRGFKTSSEFSWKNPPYEQDDFCPVTCVSKDDILAFCKWLGGKIDNNVQLPTEAQWEYACRAGGSTESHVDDLDKVAWYVENSDYKAHPVGTKKSNAWGLYDMLGNQWELCLDDHRTYTRQSVTDPFTPSETRSIGRGGSWDSGKMNCRPAIRWGYNNTDRSFNVTFRCAIVSELAMPTLQKPSVTPKPVVKGNAGIRMVKTVNGVEFAFRYCPPGTFMMGSPKNEPGRESYEIQHEVTLTKGFWMLETEITQRQWKAIMGNNPSYSKDDDLPVEMVSWNDCQEFCRKTGFDFPTEAQWEYACRAGTTGAYAGDLDAMAWYSSNSSRITHPVGTKKPNAWGLYDMHGNVYEWCADWYGYYSSERVTDPTGPSSGVLRVERGGCSADTAKYNRSAHHHRDAPQERNRYLGFRCILNSAFIPKSDRTTSAIPESTSINRASAISDDNRKTVTVNGVEIAFRWCPPGTFMMGSPDDEPGRQQNETQHQVTLTKGFWIMETEVTVGMFKAFVDETGYESKGNTPVIWIERQGMKYYPECSWRKTDFYQDNNHPVTCISWADALEFNKWLGSKLGQDVELPTEAQWEYACRAGTTDAYAGDLDQMAWYEYNANKKTHRVAQKEPNNWGIYDMHGNVWEWCNDCYYSYSNNSLTDPAVNNSNTPLKAIRGGSFIANKSRSASRNWSNSTSRGLDLGFRSIIVSDLASYSRQINSTTDNNAGVKMVKIINGVEFTFRWCPPGTFMMGSPEDEKNRDNDETQHQVTLTKGFWMLETEVTEKQWKVIMGKNTTHFPRGDDRHVGFVTWNDCQEFCKKCTKLGFPVQLPTEAQWEYACRAGSTEAYSGNLDDMAWYCDNSGGVSHPVRTKKPNAWGLYDMHGNAWEWCADWYGVYPDESVTDPIGPSNGVKRVNRGGGFGDSATGVCRSANRGNFDPDFGLVFNGFRCVLNTPFISQSDRTSTENPKSIVINRIPAKSDDNRKTVMINGVEFAFRWCPAGKFTMGSPESESGHNSYESQHQVTISNGFWIMETEVTQKQWKAITGKTPSSFEGDNLPVENISWNDCIEFCKTCSRHGLNVQMPTEEQWEYACRAGTKTAFAGKLDDMGWYSSNSAYETHPVGTKTPNAWGLYDMHGNVWEWCLDRFADYSANNRLSSSERRGSGRVIRGGAWFSFANSCPSANRSCSLPDYKCGGIGIRCVVNSKVLFDENAIAHDSEITPENIGFGKKAGEQKTCKIKGVVFAFRWCPAGNYTMGSPEFEYGRCASNEQQRRVNISEGFWIMETEVTQKQWYVIMGNNPSYFKGANNPVERVSWNDCQIFCKKTGLSLPTEEQWEYACRAGTTGKYAGNNIDDLAWYSSNSDSRTHSVGFKEPNEWGLYDMHGNVWEWCSNKESGSSDRVVRGGCWYFPAEGCRSAMHGAFPIQKQNNLTGFRCVIVPQISESIEDDAQIDKNKKAGTRMVKEINGVEIAFRWCPSGMFTMGSPSGEVGHREDEKQRKVTLTKGFWIMETEVTLEQYIAITGKSPIVLAGSSDSHIDFKIPATWISWSTAQEFCQKCTKLGLPLKLPTEAQWEYACRAGTTGPYAGDLDEMAWYSVNSGGKPHTVGTKKPNSWGIYDMHGNVMEWCQDFSDVWSDDVYDPSEDTIDPTGATEGKFHIFRGGYYGSAANDCRSARSEAKTEDGCESYAQIMGIRCIIGQ